MKIQFFTYAGLLAVAVSVLALGLNGCADSVGGDVTRVSH